MSQHTPNLLGNDVRNGVRDVGAVAAHDLEALGTKHEQKREHGPGHEEAPGHGTHQVAANTFGHHVERLNVHLRAVRAWVVVCVWAGVALTGQNRRQTIFIYLW
jgi:hypothetical protein